MEPELKIFPGRSGAELTEKICSYLNLEKGKITVRNFSDGEIWVRVEETVRNAECFIVQSTCSPVNENLMEIFIMLDALKRSSAKQITVVLPYYCYSRQDRKDQPHVPISSKLVANLLVTAGADRVLTIDLHADQIQGFFDVPLDHLLTAPLFVQHIRENVLNDENIIVVAPDTGSAKRARNMAERLNTTIAICDKKRYTDDHTEVMYVVGDVKDKVAVIVDDLLSTGGTLVNTASALKKAGATEIYAYCTHGILAGKAVQKIEESPLDKVYITDTIRQSQDYNSSKIDVLSVAPLLAEAIWRTYKREGVSSLYI